MKTRAEIGNDTRHHISRKMQTKEEIRRKHKKTSHEEAKKKKRRNTEEERKANHRMTQRTKPIRNATLPEARENERKRSNIATQAGASSRNGNATENTRKCRR